MEVNSQFQCKIEFYCSLIKVGLQPGTFSPASALRYCGFSGEVATALRGGRAGVSRELELRSRGLYLPQLFHSHSILCGLPCLTLQKNVNKM
jgi:hypothetical protein